MAKRLNISNDYSSGNCALNFTGFPEIIIAISGSNIEMFLYIFTILIYGVRVFL